MTIEDLDYQDMTDTLDADTRAVTHTTILTGVAALTAVIAPTPIRIAAIATALTVLIRQTRRHLTRMRAVERLLTTTGGLNAYLDAYGTDA